MGQFLLNFHHFPLPKNVVPTEAEFEAINKQWQDYIGGIAGQGKFVGTQRLDQEGTIIGPDGKLSNAVTDGKGLVVGTLTIEADSLDEAVELSKGCPVLAMGGSVEVRPVLAFDV
ncbi:MAG: transcription initiation protein [Ferruginibacter sp.]|nr:transcription initiation protein [Ferruginibacter sp.]